VQLVQLPSGSEQSHCSSTLLSLAAAAAPAATAAAESTPDARWLIKTQQVQQQQEA
jgi:hypothetical protein